MDRRVLVCLFVTCLGTCISILQHNQEILKTTRVVVTFHTWDQASGEYNVGNFTVVNQYGRRLVLDLGRYVELSEDSPIITDMIGADIVEIVESDGIGSVLLDPVNYQWQVANSEPYSIKVENIWKLTNSTPNTRIAILDTGIAAAARGAFLNIDSGYDFVSNTLKSLDGDGRDPDPTDPGDAGPSCLYSTWHGTGVAGVVASSHDLKKGLGMKGVAQNSTIIPIRILGLCGSGSFADAADAITYASGGLINGIGYIPIPAKIISISMGSTSATCPTYLQSAITQAINLGSIVVVAAGNDNTVNVSNHIPSNCIGVISVGASGRTGKLASYSTTGAMMIAPGGDNDYYFPLLYIYQGNLSVGYATGTSFACPMVSGSLALVFSLCKNIVNSSQFIDMFDTKAIKTKTGIQLNMEMLSMPEACSGVTNKCSTNQYLNSTSSVCTTCAPQDGYRSRCLAWNAAICEKCPAGKYLLKNGTASRCISCTVGKFSNTSDSSSCTTCDPGTFTNIERSISCIECIYCTPGKYTSCDVYGSGSCVPCPVGKYSDTYSLNPNGCTPCPQGTYADTTGSSTCLTCQNCTTNGYYKSGCDSASSGTCTMCTNS